MTRALSQAERGDLARLALLAEYAPRHQEPGDITHADAMKAWRVGQQKALKMLARMVDDGKVERIENVILDNGKRGRVWRPVKKGKA